MTVKNEYPNNFSNRFSLGDNVYVQNIPINPFSLWQLHINILITPFCLCLETGLNHWPKDFQSFTLPTELPRLYKIILLTKIPDCNEKDGIWTRNFWCDKPTLYHWTTSSKPTQTRLPKANSTFFFYHTHKIPKLKRKVSVTIILPDPLIEPLKSLN